MRRITFGHNVGRTFTINSFQTRISNLSVFPYYNTFILNTRCIQTQNVTFSNQSSEQIVRPKKEERHINVEKELAASEKRLEGIKNKRNSGTLVFYQNLLQSYCGKNDSKIEGVLKAMEEEGKVNGDIKFYSILVDHYGKIKNFAKMEEVFEKVKKLEEITKKIFEQEVETGDVHIEPIKRDVIFYTTLIDHFGANKNIEKMEKYFKLMKNESKLKGNVRTYQKLVEHYGSAKLVDKIQEILVEVENKQIRFTREFILVYFNQLGNLKQFKLMKENFDRLKKNPLLFEVNEEIDVSVYNVLFYHYSIHFEYQKIDKLFNEILMSENQNFNVYTFTILINCFVKGKQVERVNSIYLIIKQLDVQLPLYCYTLLIEFFANVGDIRNINNIYADLLQLESQLTGKAPRKPPQTPDSDNVPKNGKKSKEELYYLPDNLRQITKEDGALSHEYITTPFTISIYNSLLNAYGRNKDYKRMEEVLKRLLNDKYIMSKSSYVLNEGINKQTYNILINHYGKAKHLEKMEHSFNDMLGRGINPDVFTLTSLIDGYGRLRMWKKINQTLLDMKHKYSLKPNISTFTSIITNLGRADYFDKMEFYVKLLLNPELSQATGSVNHLELDETSEELKNEQYHQYITIDVGLFNSIISNFSRVNNFSKIEYYLDLMRKLNVEPDKKTLSYLMEYSKRSLDSNKSYVRSGKSVRS